MKVILDLRYRAQQGIRLGLELDVDVDG